MKSRETGLSFVGFRDTYEVAVCRNLRFLVCVHFWDPRAASGGGEFLLRFYSPKEEVVNGKEGAVPRTMTEEIVDS